MSLKIRIYLPGSVSAAIDALPAVKSGNRLCAALLAGVCAGASPANVAAVDYSAMPAVDCVINPYRVVDISSPVPGVIEKLYVERSQQVSAGEVVAELEANVERANVELARYRAGMQSELGLSQVNVNFDHLRKQRVDSLQQSQNVSRETADQIEREVQLSRWKLRQARELLDVRQLELRRAEQQLRQKSVRAPFDGFVLDTFKYRGEYVEEQAILRLAQLDPLVIETIVPMEYFGKIAAGMEAEIRPEVLLDEKLIGTVTVVDRIGDTASNTFGVKLSMPNPEHRIPAGLKCIVKFIGKPERQIAADPRPANDPGVPSTTADPGSADLLADESRDDAPRPTALLASLELDPSFATAKESPSTYMVLLAQPHGKDAARGLVESLRDAGISDLLKIDHGVNKGTISAGVYSKRDYALGRQRQLAVLGFDAFIVERFR